MVEDQLVGQRSGRTYTVPGTRVQYTASAPGEAPASRTGVYRTGWKFRGIDENSSEVGHPADLSIWLEKGTSRMKPRPHIRAGYDSRKMLIQEHLARRWDG